MSKKIHFGNLDSPTVDNTVYPRVTININSTEYYVKTAKADSTNKKAGTECIKIGDYEWLIKNSWDKLLPDDCTSYMSQNYASTYQTMTALPEELQDVDTSNVTNMSGMFRDCNAIKSIPQLDTSKVTDMSEIFCRCNAITSIPQLDTSKVTNMSGMFGDCNAIKSIPQLDTSKVTDMSAMFCRCNAITSIPQLDTSKVTNMIGMFDGCNAIKSIPQLDTSNVTNMSYMFLDCSAITSIPKLDTSKVTTMSYMFNNCTSLPTVFPWTIDCVSITTINGINQIFTNSSVKEVTFKNVNASIKSQFNAANLGSQLTKIVIENTI